MSILRIGDQPPRPSEPFPIHARSGWQIPQEMLDPKSAALVRIRARELMNWRGGLTLRSTSSHPYNCVGLIFASRRAWIEIDHIYDLLREDGFRNISQREAMIDDVVLYKKGGSPTHVALIMSMERIGQSVNIRVLSKWGQDAEFLHFVENVPDFFGSPTEYWTERPYETE